MTDQLLAQLRASFEVTPEKLSEAVSRLVEAGNPVKVVLFGSRARGDADSDSDIDMAVILDRVDTASRSPVGSRLLDDIDLNVDLLVTDLEHFETFRQYGSSVHHDIATEGVVLYERGRDATANGDVIAQVCRR